MEAEDRPIVSINVMTNDREAEQDPDERIGDQAAVEGDQSLIRLLDQLEPNQEQVPTTTNEQMSMEKNSGSDKRYKSLYQLIIIPLLLLLILVAAIHVSISPIIIDSLDSFQNHPIDQQLRRSLNYNPTLNSISIEQLNPPPDDQSLQFGLSVELNLFIQLDVRNFLTPEGPQSSTSWNSKLIHWFIHQSPNSIINLVNSNVLLHPIYPDLHPPLNLSSSKPILQVEFIDPFNLPLIYPSSYHSQNRIPQTNTQLKFNLRFLSPHPIIHLLNYSINHPQSHFRLTIDHLDLRLDGSRFPNWISRLIQAYSRFTLSNLTSQIAFKIPDSLSSILKDPSSLIQINEYSFHPVTTSEDGGEPNSLGIRATGSIPNPLLGIRNYSDRVNLNLEIPWRFPLLIDYLEETRNQSTDNRGSNSSKKIQEGQLLARGLTVPFRLNDSNPLLSIDIDGVLVESLAHQNNSGPLTPFLNRFLHGQLNQLLIRYDLPQFQGEHNPILVKEKDRVNEMEKEHHHDVDDDEALDNSDINRLVIADQQVNQRQFIFDDSFKRSLSSSLVLSTRPKFIERLLKDLELEVRFPGSNVTELVKSLDIKDMKIDLTIKLKVLCSGEIRGILELPPQLKNLSNLINITQIQPDVILLDGPLPNSINSTYQANRIIRASSLTKALEDLYHEEGEANDDDDDDGGQEYPSNAFGRLRSTEWIDAKLKITEGEEEGGEKTIELISRMEKVEMKVLKGRNKQFRDFVSKYLLHHKRNQEDPNGVLISLIGFTNASASLLHNNPLPILINKLPLSGSFLV